MASLTKRTAGETWLLGAVVFCFLLAFIVAPLLSPGVPSAQWVPLVIGAVLAVQFWTIKRRRISATE